MQEAAQLKVYAEPSHWETTINGTSYSGYVGTRVSMMESRHSSKTETFARTQMSRYETSQDI